MTSTLAHGVGRSSGEPVRPLSVLALSPALIALLLGGLILRLTIAYVLFPASGFETDLASYGSWAATMAEHGPTGFYEHVGFADYPPAYLYVLWAVGLLAGAGGDPGELIKLPPILIDLGIAYLLYRLVRGWTWPGARSSGLALAAAALYLFNPVTLYDSALWGQTDAAGALVMLLTMAALIRGNSEGAAALAATAALVKPQFGVVLIPLVAVVLLKRHLLRPGSGPQHRPWAPPRLREWLSSESGWPRLLTAFAAAWVAFFVISLPFGMGPVEYLERMSGTAGGYGYLTVNAYNLWAFVSVDGGPSLATGPSWNEDTIGLLGPIPGVVIGAVLLLAGFAWGVLRAAARDDRWTLLVAVTFLAIAFFILPTRVHERYVFPVVALMPLLAVVSRRWLVALLLLSVGAFINMHGILTWPIYGTSNVETLAFGEWFRTEGPIAVAALLQTGVGLWVAWQLRPSLRTSPDAFEREATALPPVVDATGSAIPNGGEVAEEEPWVAGPSLLDYLVARLSWGSLRRDRSATLAAEPGGRLGRLDLLVLIVLVVVAITARGYRLEEPTRMYFDEVYHARTATEFLQHWEYGEPHDIYEFTHPHLAKYAMAWGIRLAGGNELTGVADLGLAVEDAALERRWGPDGDELRRDGDRLYVASNEALGVYDLATREKSTQLPLAATALALDEGDHRLYLADLGGALHRLDTTALDARRHDGGENDGDGNDGPPIEVLSAGPHAAVDQLLVTDVSLLAVTAGSLVAFDTETGAWLAERHAVAVNDVVELPWSERLLVDTGALDDPLAAAEIMAEALAADALSDVPVAEVQRLAGLFQTDGYVVVTAYLGEAVTEAVTEAVESGRLPGTTIEQGPLVAIAGPGGIEVLDAWTLDLVDEIATDEPVTALFMGGPDSDEPTLYAAGGDGLLAIDVGDDGPGFTDEIWMPGSTRDLAWNDAAGLLHVLGDAPDGGPTIYVVEPRGQAVFADVELPFEPSVLLTDTNPDFGAADRTELLAVAPDGAVAGVEIGRNAFGWRLPGVLLGALAAALIYLLARALFARRSVALIAAVLVVAEGMFFANARIAMNDVYVTTFIVLAALLFVPLYLRPLRPWTALALLLGVGVALGLALAAKWVALYAIGGLGLLVLFRSALGRALALLVMLALTAVFGAMAIQAPAGIDEPAYNWIFLLLMLVLTGLLAAAMVRRPLPLTRAEVLLAAVVPTLVGVALAVTGHLLPGGLALGTGAVVMIAVTVATRLGHGPFAARAKAPPEGTSAWLRPGPHQVMPWLVTMAALTILPLAVYIASYAPWVALGNDWGLPLFGSLPFLPGSTEDGRTILDLTESMYRYHDNLRASHAASSPWWAWPLDFKPVWFFSQSYAGERQGLIYDTGNLVVFWLGLAGMGFTTWSAWRRRSLSLALVAVMWAALWLPWARIDRATFQYHVYASLPFLTVGLAYFLAELWHGPSTRTWFLARVAAALAIIGAPLLWLLRTPLCILAGTAVAKPDGLACASEVTRTAQLSQAGVTAFFLLGAGIAFAVYLGWRGSGATGRYPGDRSISGPWLAALGIVALATLGAVVAAIAFLDTSSATALPISSDLLAIVALVVLAMPAWLVLHARDPRRFVLGVLGAAVLWLLIWYPNLSGLPLPSDFAAVYQALLPTWVYDFQFAVNTDPASDVDLISDTTLLVGAVAAVFVGGVGLVAWRWSGSAGEPAEPSTSTPPGQQH